MALQGSAWWQALLTLAGGYTGGINRAVLSLPSRLLKHDSM
jgi:hypothetical protein